MAETLTFIHASDLHLGAPFKGLRAVSDAWANRLTEAIPEAYERVIDAALENHVDFLVLAGDTFDLAVPSYRQCTQFTDGLERLNQAGIPVYLVTGNHDPLVNWKSSYIALPENVHMFPAAKPGFFLQERDGAPLVMLCGRGFYNQAWPQDKNIAEGISRGEAVRALECEAPFAVGVLHTGLDVDSNRAPVKRTELYARDMDYWALGHIHTPMVDDAQNPRIAFSGCIQGRAMSETGPRGINLVTLTKGQPCKVEFIPTASVVWQCMDVDVSSCVSLSEVEHAVIRALYAVNGDAQCREMVERISLIGATHLHQTLQRADVRKDLRLRINDKCPQFFCDALLDDTSIPFDRKALAKEGLFPATFLQVSQGMTEESSKDAAYLQQAFMDKGLSLPLNFEHHMDGLAEEAEGLVLNLLGGGVRG